MKNIISLKEYFDKGDVFVIPNYQRGYVWGKANKSDKNSVEFILDTIKKGYSSNNTNLFLQGVTVSETTNREIELIDGQQRTTFFYLLLCYLGYDKEINIKYTIRKDSEKFLGNIYKKDVEKICEMCEKDENEEYQDIFFFKKTLRHIHKELKNCDREELKRYILNHIKFLYINILLEKAIKTFTMMNGSKAIMLPEELIKAEMLRQISQNTEIEETSFKKEWEINALRSRYAREWDKWLYWWNKEDVKYFFKVKNPMGLLLEYYYLNLNKENAFTFNRFKTLLSSKRETMFHFKGLRNLQKSFEDIFNNPIIYNLLGVALKDCGKDKSKIILFFIDNKHDNDVLAELTKWRVVGATFKQITTNPDKLEEKDTLKEEKAQETLHFINKKIVYKSDGDTFARKYLLYLNVLEDNKANEAIGRKFNFSIYDEQSLEHIHPKSKVYHVGKDNIYYNGNNDKLGEKEPIEEEWLNRDQCPEMVSEHSIGNLVLLVGRDNSAFGNKSFNEKKNIYFNLDEKFKSRELLHTISVFAKEKWGIKEITENQKKIISKIEQDYGIKSIVKTQDNE